LENGDYADDRYVAPPPNRRREPFCLMLRKHLANKTRFAFVLGVLGGENRNQSVA